ncbi:MAG: FIST signal transduction protein [Acidobacteriota bacterium]
MTESAVVYTSLSDSVEAGAFIGGKILEDLGGNTPDALIVFASSRYVYPKLLEAIKASCGPKIIVGCSSAGEFTSTAQGEGSVSAVGIRSSDMKFQASLGRGLRADRKAAAKEIAADFLGPETHHYQFRSALILTDALAGHADDLIEQINLFTAGTYQLFGGGAGDDGKFSHTHVFFDTEAVSDAVVALEILSNKPLGIGVSHGWTPATGPMRVTEVDGMNLISVNAVPAVETFHGHAEATGQAFDRANPLPFFLHNVIGVDTGDGYKLRVPLSVNPDGSVACAADIPAGATIRIMRATSSSSSAAAENATESALRQLQGNRPKVALFFDCVATRIRLGEDFSSEMHSLENTLGPAQYAGCNTYGQVARADGQFSGFHNCTAVVCIIPQ